jgi:uncharacterized PurR-regulated membrane protein YhhQ (DUF165 family)
MTARNRGAAVALALTFIGCIAAANYVTSRYGVVPVGFGLTATAGTYLAGITFVARDSVQDLAGRWWVVALIATGALLSYALSAPVIALASGVALACSELADLAIYSPLRRHGYVRAAVASNVAGAVVDTVLFLWVAGFPVLPNVPGQVVGKLVITLAVVTAVALVRVTARRGVTA